MKIGCISLISVSKKILKDIFEKIFKVNRGMGFAHC